MNLGLYGGSFDPVHLGHLLVAQAAMEEARLDHLYFVPAAQSPFKPGRQMAPASLRVAMLELALARLERCEVDMQELSRGGVSYTVDTVRDYQRRFPDAALHYLIGADHVPLLPKWREAEALAASLHFLVIPRPGLEPHPFPPGFRGTYLKGTPIAVSSSLIRDRVKSGLPIDLLTLPAVAEEIRNNGLYL